MVVIAGETHTNYPKRSLKKAAETAYLCGYYDEMDSIAEELLKNSNSFMDNINVYETIINAHIAQYQLEEAIRVAFDVLGKLNVRLSGKASQVEGFQRIHECKICFGMEEGLIICRNVKNVNLVYACGHASVKKCWGSCLFC